jgi:HSP20 family protein
MTNSKEIDAKTDTSLERVAKAPADAKLPAFVEAETMFEKFAEITKDTAQKAFDFFRERGGEIGKELDDWFKAENEILRPVPIEMTESDANIFVSAAVPGFKPEEIEVSVKDDVLIISGTTETNKTSDDASMIVSEWKSDRFYRQLPLPSRIMPENVEAKLSDGILKLTLPKAAKNDAKKVAVASA